MLAQGRSPALVVNAAWCVAFAVSLVACRSEPAPIDAPLADVRSDAMEACTDYPVMGIRLCPSYQPYCCPLGQYMFCSADSRDGTCMEHPIGGLRQPCDRTNGDGCPSDRAVCCGIDDITFCTDHAYVGRWECSPASASWNATTTTISDQQDPENAGGQRAAGRARMPTRSTSTYVEAGAGAAPLPHR